MSAENVREHVQQALDLAAAGEADLDEVRDILANAQDRVDAIEVAREGEL